MADTDFAFESAADARAAAAIEAMLAARERDEFEEEAPSPSALETTGPSPLDLAKRVSAAAFDLIVDFETGGKAFYKTVFKERPVWPKEKSGVTIGFGYDLGYVTVGAFNSDWAALDAGARAAFAPAIGQHGGNSTPVKMQSLLAAVKSIVVPWDMAEAVFAKRSLPEFAAKTYAALPNCDLLSADCFGVLVSLTFNRGASYGKAHDPAKDPNDRYREMRQIKAAMQARNFGQIPAIIRAMVRIWQGTAVADGMKRRRVAEAELFETGLTAPAVAAVLNEAAPAAARGSALERTAVPAAAATFIVDGEEVSTAASDEELFADVGDDDVALEATQPGGGRRAALETAAVSWSADGESFDYAHLGGNLPVNAAFPLRGEDLALLAELNDFPVGDAGQTPVLFGLRGCLIVKDHTATEVTLRDVRPDHRTPRCVLGVWRRETGQVFVFPGSTVPNANAVNSWFTRKDAGNLLPTGLYRYIAGTHNEKPGCFLLRKTVDEKRVVVVRRSSNNLRYDLADIVDRMAPGDNIHPTFHSQPTGFSSVGCQTVVGSANTGGNHSGPWAKFRQAAGESDANGNPGKPFLYLLLTGAEARLAAEMRLNDLAADPVSRRRLRRLRFGSRGAAVAALQGRLGIGNPDGDFGPGTGKALHDFQATLPPGGRSDGILSPALDTALGWHVLGFVGA